MENRLTPEAFAILMQRYMENTCSPADTLLLLQHLEDPAFEGLALELIDGAMNKAWDDEQSCDAAVWQRLQQRLPHKRSLLRLYPIRWAAAAAIIIVAGVSTWALMRNTNGQQVLTRQQRYKNEVAPAVKGAILSVAGGNTIVLDTAKDGKVFNQFIKTAGVLQVATNELLYATLTAPDAHIETLELNDGTQVYLNAGSSITFPTLFQGNERMVSITGEAYFVVKHNAHMPFRVQLRDGAMVEDLGTEFNINAYDNEAAINTTLIEGKVRVQQQQTTLDLTPGQQASVTGNAELLLNATPDIEDVLAWKNGVFNFKEAGMEVIMRQIARWYGVTVSFTSNIEGVFVLELPRNLPLSKVLGILEETGKVKFVIEGKKLLVLPPQ